MLFSLHVGSTYIKHYIGCIASMTRGNHRSSSNALHLFATFSILLDSIMCIFVALSCQLISNTSISTKERFCIFCLLDFNVCIYVAISCHLISIVCTSIKERFSISTFFIKDKTGHPLLLYAVYLKQMPSVYCVLHPQSKMSRLGLVLQASSLCFLFFAHQIEGARLSSPTQRVNVAMLYIYLDSCENYV